MIAGGLDTCWQHFTESSASFLLDLSVDIETFLSADWLVEFASHCTMPSHQMRWKHLSTSWNTSSKETNNSSGIHWFATYESRLLLRHVIVSCSSEQDSFVFSYGIIVNFYSQKL